MDEPFNGYRLDRTAFSVVGLHDQGDEHLYWHTQPPDERLRALEFLRYHAYGYDPIADRIPRVLEVAQRPPR